MSKAILIPLDEYEREQKDMKEKAHSDGFRSGQQAYLRVLKQIVLMNSLTNCSIMWAGMNVDEKKILEKLIDVFIAKNPAISPTSPTPVK